MADALPPCPGCRAPLDWTRLLWRAYSSSSAAMPAFHELNIACGSCLSISRTIVFDEGQVVDPPEVIAPGASAARLRERLIAARESGRLDEEVASVIASEEMPVLGVPEVFREARSGIGGGFVRLVTEAQAHSPWFPAVDMPLPTPRWQLQKLSSHLSKQDLSLAESEGLGGFLFQGNLRVLRATRFAVAGIAHRSYLLSPPRTVLRRWGDHPGFLADTTLVLPDRVGRP